MKYYCFEIFDGNAMKVVIISNPTFCDGIVRRTIVAEVAGFSDEGGYVFMECEPGEFIAGGGPWVMKEYHGRIAKAIMM